MDGLRQSAYMVALVTKEYYDEGSWTSIEWEQALAEQKDKEKRRTRSF